MSVPAGSSRSPVEEALAVLDAWATSYEFVHENDVHLRFPHAALATVRAELERLTAENERLNRYIDQYILDVERLTEERDALKAERSDRFVWRAEDGPLIRGDGNESTQAYRPSSGAAE